MNQSRKPRTEIAQPDLFMSAAEVESQPEGALPDGFAYGAEIVPEALARDLVAFSFENPCRLRFRRKSDDRWERAAVTVAPRSAYLLRGPAREQWEHSIPAVDALRYAVTLRTFKPGQKPTGSNLG